MMRKNVPVLLGFVSVVLCCNLPASGQNKHYTGNRSICLREAIRRPRLPAAHVFYRASD